MTELRSSVKPFDDLLYATTTMGMEASPDSRRTALDPEGLCVSTTQSHGLAMQYVAERRRVERRDHL
jgi:hypothetical protein